MNPTIGVLALQGDVREHLAALRSLGADPISVRRPGELATCDGLVIPGGESTTMAKLATIFDLLEHGAVRDGGRYGDAVERLFGTPHSVDLAALAAAYGVAHRRVSTTAELAAALAEPWQGRSIIEVRTDRHGLRDLHVRIRAAVGAAVAPILQA